MKKFLIFAAAVLLIIAGCSPKEEPSPSGEPSPEPTVEVSPTPYHTPRPGPSPIPLPSAAPFLKGINPLSGLPMDEKFENRRPVAVMFNNIKAALPQIGISRADRIYEAMEEGGITRIIALFKDVESVPRIESIRSTRAYYLDITGGHDAILLHAGGSPEAFSLIASRKMFTVDSIRGGYGNLFKRDQTRLNAGVASEHTLYVEGAELEKVLSESKNRVDYEKDCNPFVSEYNLDPSITPGGTVTAEKISVKYSQYKTGVFTYKDGVYLVSQYGGNPLIDGETGEQLTVKNVIALYTDISAIPGDKAGRIKIRTTGSGSGEYFSEGGVVAIKWSKADWDKPYVFTLEDGKPLVESAGVTYVNILDKGSPATVS